MDRMEGIDKMDKIDLGNTNIVIYFPFRPRRKNNIVYSPCFCLYNPIGKYCDIVHIFDIPLFRLYYPLDKN